MTELFKTGFIKRRQLIQTGFLSLLWSWFPGVTKQGYAQDLSNDDEIERILFELFETSDAAEDTSIVIEAPLEAEHGLLVPFKITAPDAEKMAVFVDRNRQPLAMTLTVYPGAAPVLRGTVKMQHSSDITCYVFRNDTLYKASRHIRLGAGGSE